MLIAAGPTKNGRKALYIGLMERNMELLRNDQPIHKRLDQEPQNVPGLEEWDLYILGPEDTARFIARVS
jgi:hypothetical protein